MPHAFSTIMDSAQATSVAVKPASTAASATDPALVVTMSPNSSSPAAGAALTNDVGLQYRGTATGAAAIAKVISAASTNATSVKATAGRIVGYSLTNTTAAFKYFRLYNLAVAPTVGTSVPVLVIGLPATSTTRGELEGGIGFSVGIAYAITGSVADLDTTVTAANDVIGGLFYA